MMTGNGKFLALLGLAAAFALLRGGDEGLAADPVVLLTAEEGATANASGGLIDAGSALNTGPAIEVLKPEQNVELRSPVSIVVRFVPNGKDVDLSSLKVEVLKFVTIDITKRILPYASRNGIQAEKAILPAGEHRLRVTIGDVGGGISQKVIVVRIF